VGIPCQVLALEKIGINPLENKNNIDKMDLVIGLFCTRALSYKETLRFLKKEYPIDKIGRMDISPPPANVFQLDCPEE
jgi:coenzyme F420-reducing hydrogenase beta subunit